MPRNTVTSLVIALLSAAVTLAAAPGATVFYVAPNGNDANPGTYDKPYASLARAALAVRTLNASGLKRDVRVILRGGTYRLEQPLVLGPDDGGTDQFKVTYTAADGEQPLISGGRTITGWKKTSDNQWTVTLPEVKAGQLWFRQLYRDGQRLPRPRFPQSGFLKIRQVSRDYRTLQLNQSLPPSLAADGDTELIVVQNWSITRALVERCQDDSVTTATPAGWIGHSHCLAKPGMSVFFEHARAFLQQPGQWHLDRASGVLTYQAAPGENPNDAHFTAPVLTQLIIVNGTPDRPVRNLHFAGLRFAHSGFLIPATGYNGIQACYYGTTTKAARTFAVDVALELNYCRNCSITDAQLAHLGGSGIGLGPGCVANRIVGCELADIGATGINIGHMKIKDPLWADWTSPDQVPTANEVANCYIHHCGADLWGAHGIFDAMTRDTHIHHNEVSHLPYGGIATGYVWSTDRTSQQNCVIEYNHVHEVMLKLNDSGCLYTLGFQPGSIIRGNLLHGVRFGGFAGGQICNNGIFFDEGSKGFLLEGNVIYDVDQKAGARNTPVRFNRSSRDWQIWIDNTIETGDEPPQAARDLAEKAGLQPPYRQRFKPAAQP